MVGQRSAMIFLVGGIGQAVQEATREDNGDRYKKRSS